MPGPPDSIIISKGGTPGTPAYTHTTAAFTQPLVGSTVTVSVGSTGWMAAGQEVYVASGGYYAVDSITNLNTVLFTNSGYENNAAAGARIDVNSTVSPGGLQGPPGSAGGATIDSNGDLLIDAGAPDVDSIASLRTLAVTGFVGNEKSLVRNYYADGRRGGGGIFFWDTTQAERTITSVDPTTDTVSFALDSNYPAWHNTGRKVQLYGSGLSGGITQGTVYYITSITYTSVQLATTFANAVAATPTVVDITTAGSGTMTWILADDGGRVIRNSSSRAGVWRRLYDGSEWHAADFGVVEDSTQNNDDLNTYMISALEARGLRGGTLKMMSGFHYLSGGIQVPANVVVEGDAGPRGTWIQHTGNNACLTWSGNGDTLTGIGEMSRTRGARRLSIGCTTPISSSQKAIVSIEGGKGIWEDLEASNYASGTGIELQTAYTTGSVGNETNQLRDVFFLNCLKSLAFVNNAGLGSFSDTRVFGMKVDSNVTNSIGIYVGNGALVYAGSIEAKMQSATSGFTAVYLDGSGSGGNYTTRASIEQTFCNIAFETTVTTTTLVRMAGFDRISGLGSIHATNNIATPSTIPSTAFYQLSKGAVKTDNGNASVTLVAPDAGDTPYRIQRFNTTLTANRNITLPAAGRLMPGDWFRIVRGSGATGAFSLTVQDASSTTIKAMGTSASTWCEVTWDGANWILTANGSL